MFRRLETVVVLGLALTTMACASIDPDPALIATAGMLEERGVSGAQWRRQPAEFERADDEIERLLARPLSTGDAGRLALLRSPDLQAALAELGIAQAELAQATRFANPGVSFSRLRGGGETEKSSGIAADVVDWLTQPLRRRLGTAQLERVKLEVASVLFDTVTASELALVEVRKAEAMVQAFEDREAVARVSAEYAQVLHEAGNLTLRERAQAEAAWADAQAQVALQKEESERTRERLRRLTGLTGEQTWSVDPLDQPPTWDLPSSEDLQTEALRTRLDVAAARWAVDVLEGARKLHRATRWLPVGVELGVERESEDGVRLTGPTVELALPIFDSGAAALAVYDAQIARAMAQLENLEANVRSEVREALAVGNHTRARIDILRGGLVPARRRALELTVLEANQMLVGMFELLEAKERLVEAEADLLEATADAWRNWLDLMQALGRTMDLPAQAMGHQEMKHDHSS